MNSETDQLEIDEEPEIWIGLKPILGAARAFQSSVERATQMLAGLDAASPALEWVDEFGSDVEEIIDEIVTTEGDQEAALELLTSLRDRAEEFDEYISSYEDIAFDTEEAVGTNADPKLKENITDFVCSRIQPVHRAAIYFYHALLGA